MAYNGKENSSDRFLSRSFESRNEKSASSFIKMALANIALTSTMFGFLYLVSHADKRNAELITDDAPIESGLAEDSLAVRQYHFLANVAHAMTKSEAIVIERNDLETSDEALAQDSKTDEIAISVPEHQKEELLIEKEPKSTEDYMWNYFRKQGYSPIMAAAIMGNLKQESGLKPHDRPITYRGGAAFGGLGVAQWNGGRRQKLIAMYPDSYEKTESQLEYIHHELSNNYQDVKDDMQKTNSLIEAVAIFQNRYEKCDINHCNLTSRSNWAEKYYDKFVNG